MSDYKKLEMCIRDSFQTADIGMLLAEMKRAGGILRKDRRVLIHREIFDADVDCDMVLRQADHRRTQMCIRDR